MVRVWLVLGKDNGLGWNKYLVKENIVVYIIMTTRLLFKMISNYYFYNNKHLIKVKEWSWSWFKEAHVDCRYETGNKQRSPVLKSDV